MWSRGIESAPVPLNRDYSGLSPEAYLHLVNRNVFGGSMRINRDFIFKTIVPDESTRPECGISLHFF